MIDKVSIIVVIKACLSFDLTNSSLKISELESSNGPILKQNKLIVVEIYLFLT